MEISNSRGKVLLHTIHGSQLYGTNHGDSDRDYYTVTEHGKSRQYKKTLEDGSVLDHILIGLTAFSVELEKGTHQALEAAFSDEAEYAEGWKPYFSGLRVYSVKVEETYCRTARHLCDYDTFKLNRHALRIASNLQDLRLTGRFNPRLSDQKLRTFNYLAKTLSKESLRIYLKSYLDNTRFRD